MICRRNKTYQTCNTLYMNNYCKIGRKITNKLRGGGGSLTNSPVTCVLMVLEKYDKYQMIAYAMF